MKIIITESQYEKLPNSLKRRITPDDFKDFDRELFYYIDDTPWVPDFDQFSYDVISSLVTEFIFTENDNEIPDYGGTLDIDNETSKIFKIYSDLIPVLEKRYKDRLHQAWKVKARTR